MTAMRKDEAQKTSPKGASQTAAHYDEHPFDFMDGTEDPSRSQPAFFRRFVREYMLPGQSVIDVGCGAGRDLMFLEGFGFRLTGVDVSTVSLEMARDRVPSATFHCVNNLELPFGDGSFDVVISDGVIHHTPDPHKAFLEDTRMLRKGGYLYLAVYRRWRYYYYIYAYMGRPVRWLVKRSWGRMLIHCSLLPPYYFAHLIKSGGKRSWYAARNLFYDYIITPQASFHTREEIVGWAAEAGLTLVDYDEKGLGNCHGFIFRK